MWWKNKMAFYIDESLKQKWSDFEHITKIIRLDDVVTLLELMEKSELLSADGKHIKDMFEFKYK